MSAALAAQPFLRNSLENDLCHVNRILHESPALRPNHSDTAVEEAMRYAVFADAQRIRPILALRVGRLLQAPPDVTAQTATAVELVHCASLILDDLPCMDDSNVRRGRPSVHIQFGEATAILAAFCLVIRGAYSVIEPRSASLLGDQLTAFGGELLRSLGCTGLIAGQSFDLDPHQRWNAYSLDNLKKTVPLFTLSVSAGLTGSMATEEERTRLLSFGREFGTAYQIADDWQDGNQYSASLFSNAISMLRHLAATFGSDGHQLHQLVDLLQARGPHATT